MLKDCLYLLSCDARKPLQKIVYGCTVLEIVKQGMHRHASASKNPCSADFPGVLFHLRTVIPITIHEANNTRFFCRFQFAYQSRSG